MSSTHVCAHTFHRAHLLSAAAIFLIPSFAAHANELPGKERESAASTRQAAIKKTPEQSSRNTSKQLGAHVKTGAAVPISSNAAERLVVTATRTPQQIQDVPASVSLITRQDIQMRQSSTISDASIACLMSIWSARRVWKVRFPKSVGLRDARSF